MNKDKKSKNTSLCVEKKVFGKLFQASPKGVKRMDALNKLAKNLSGKDFHASREAVSVKKDTNNNRLVLLFRRLAEGKKPKHKRNVFGPLFKFVPD